MTLNRLHTLLAASICTLITGCGGGGGGDDGETLQVDFFYNPTNNVQVWQPGTRPASISGLDGHAPSCRLTAGSLPAGVALNGSTCAIEGTPAETGDFPYTITLTASGAKGAVSTQGTFTVPPLNLNYGNGPIFMTWGQHLGPLAPTIAGYTPQAGDTVSYAYLAPASATATANGDQQTYFTLDPATGTLAGTPIGHPQVLPTLNIEATIHRGGHAVKASFAFAQGGDIFAPQVTFATVNLVSVGVPFTIAPTSAPAFVQLGYSVTYSYDQAGINSCRLSATPVVDPASGAISGTLTFDGGACFVSVKYVATNGAVTFTGVSTALLT